MSYFHSETLKFLAFTQNWWDTDCAVGSTISACFRKFPAETRKGAKKKENCLLSIVFLVTKKFHNREKKNGVGSIGTIQQTLWTTGQFLSKFRPFWNTLLEETVKNLEDQQFLAYQ